MLPNHRIVPTALCTFALVAAGAGPAGAAAPPPPAPPIPKPAQVILCAANVNDADRGLYSISIHAIDKPGRENTSEVIGEVNTGEGGKVACEQPIPLVSGQHILYFINDFESVSFKEDWTPKKGVDSRVIRTVLAQPYGKPVTVNLAPNQQVPVQRTDFVVWENHTTTITVYVMRTKPEEPIKTKKKH